MSGNNQGDGRGSSDIDNDDDDDNLPASIVNVWGHPSIELITVDIPTADGKTVQKTSFGYARSAVKRGPGKNLRRLLLTGQGTSRFA